MVNGTDGIRSNFCSSGRTTARRDISPNSSFNTDALERAG